MPARTLPTEPTFTAGQELTSSLMNQLVTYSTFWANPPMFRMYQSVLQASVPNAAWTQVTLDVSQWDTDSGRSGASPWNYVIPFAGRWEFTYCAQWGTNATGARYQALYQNGAAVPSGGSTNATAVSGLNTLPNTDTITVSCSVGDTIGLWAFQTSGGALTTGGLSFLEGRLVSLANP